MVSIAGLVTPDTLSERFMLQHEITLVIIDRRSDPRYRFAHINVTNNKMRAVNIVMTPDIPFSTLIRQLPERSTLFNNLSFNSRC